MRLTKAERKAAAAVLTMAAAVTVSGIRLLKKHTQYLAAKAAAHFSEEDDAEQEPAEEKSEEEKLEEKGPEEENPEEGKLEEENPEEEKPEEEPVE